MRRIALLLLLVAGLAAAQTTPNLHLNIPTTGTPNWGPLVNSNMSLLDSYLTGVTPLPLSLSLTGNLTLSSAILQNGSGSGTVTVQPQATAGTWTFKWPNSGGSVGQCLVTDGTGVASWVPCGSLIPVQRASVQAGATSDVQITNAISLLPGGNGIVWADYSANQTWAACPTFGSGNVHLLLYPITFSVSVNCTVPPNVTLEFKQGTNLAPANATTTTIQGNILSPVIQIFSNIASGQGALLFTSNRTLSTYSPVWFGIDCTGTNDNAPVWNQILSFVGEDVTMLVPNNCSQKVASTITVSSRAGFKLMSMDRAQNGGGNQRPIFTWTGSTGGMWDFQANQAPTIEGFSFTNGGAAHLDYYLRFDGNPSTRIGTEAIIRYNTFTNNMANPGTFDAITINQISGQNHEKNVITDNDFFCSQSKAFRESNSTQISSGSQNVTCGAGNCHYTTDTVIGDRVRISYATGILDTTVQSITDDNHLVTVAAATSNQSNARITFKQAYGNAITIGSVNSKHNTIDRNGFTQCNRGLNMINGSFSGAHFGGSANDTLLYVNNISEPSEADFVEDENSMRDVFMGTSVDSPLTLSHLRNSLGISGEYDGFIYFAGSGQATILASVIQDTPASANSVVIGAAQPGSFQLTSIGNQWAPGVVTMALLGFNQWRTFSEAAATGLGPGFLISCGDHLTSSDQPGACFQFGDGGISSGTNEGHIITSSSRFGNYPSFNVFTAEPNVQVNTFVNDAIGFKTVFNAFNNSTSATFVGFDAAFKITTRGGNGVGFRYTMPNVDTTSTAMPTSYGLWVKAPTINTKITTANGVRVEDLASVTGITNHYSFFGVGATDIGHFGGPVETLGPVTFTADNTTDIGATGATRPRNIYVANQLISQVATGTAPLAVSSTTQVTNLNASFLQGLSVLSTTDTPGAITVNAGTCTDRGVALAGLATTATLFAPTANYALDANIFTSAAQAVAGTLHYRICNPTGANITLNAAATFNLRAIQ